MIRLGVTSESDWFARKSFGRTESVIMGDSLHVAASTMKPIRSYFVEDELFFVDDVDVSLHDSSLHVFEQNS